MRKTQYFAKATEKGIMTNKEFWKVMKPALTNKGVVSSDVIISTIYLSFGIIILSDGLDRIIQVFFPAPDYILDLNSLLDYNNSDDIVLFGNGSIIKSKEFRMEFGLQVFI